MNKFFERLDKRYVKICSYAGFTFLITFAACHLLQSMLPVVNEIWGLICAVFAPMIYGAAISYVMNPLVKMVSKRLRKRPRYADDPIKRRSAAVIVSVLIVALAILAVLAILLLMITHSLSSLRWSAIQELFATSQDDFLHLLEKARETLAGWGVFSGESEGVIFTAFSGIADGATTVLFSVIFGIYFLIDGPRVSRYLSRLYGAVVGNRSPVDFRQVAADADRVFSGYFRGQGIDALIVCVLSGVLLTAIGVPYGPVVGLLAGLGNLIPYVGGPVGFGSVALVCLPDANWGKMIAGFATMAVVMFVDGNILNPRLLSNTVEVHPILVVAALIGGGAIGGLAGMLVAVPAAAFLKIQLDRWIEAREAEEGARAPEEDGDPGDSESA